MAMNGLSKMAAIALLLVMVILPAAVAETFKVGDDNQWDSGVDYTKWVNGKTFRVGDILEFKYTSFHSVDVVDKAGYDGCDSSSAEKHSGGDTKIELKTVGTKYYICPTPGHCLGGMKLAVTVEAAASPGTPTTPSPPSSTPGTPTTPDSPPAAGTPATPTPRSGSTSPPPPKGSGASKGVISYVLVGVWMVLGYGLWM